MAKVTRKQVFDALFALTENLEWENWAGVAQTFQTRDRRVKLFSDVPSSQQPYLAQAQHDEDTDQVSGLPYKRVWKAQWIVYINSGNNQKATLSVDIDNILDAFEQALSPIPSDPGYPKRNTLGGLCYHCFIKGSTFKDPGDIDNQGMIVLPIHILMP